MELMEAGSLRDLLDDDDVKLSMLLCLRICTDIAKGLAFAHNLPGNKFVVHGDIKSENILLNKDLRCKIADFGSGKLSSCTKTSSSSSSSRGSPEITQLYAAPELLKNPSSSLKCAHDVYSYSIVVYEVLARRRVTETSALISLYLQKVPDGGRPDITSIEALISSNNEYGEVARKLLRIMQLCWDHEPTRRPSMSDVSNHLFHILSQFDSALILEHAAVVLRQMDIHTPCFRRTICKPISKFVCPDYNDIGNLRKLIILFNCGDFALKVIFWWVEGF